MVSAVIVASIPIEGATVADVWRKSNNLALFTYDIFSLRQLITFYIFGGKIMMTGTMDSVSFYDFTLVGMHLLIHQ